MIKVDRREAETIRTECPNAHIKIVNRGKPYKKYWVEESRGVVRVLARLRGAAWCRENKYAGGQHDYPGKSAGYCY